MTKLSDTQLVILSTACGRDDHLVFPITASLKGGALNKVLQSLLAKGLIEETAAEAGMTVWRDEDEGPLTLRATHAAAVALVAHRARQFGVDPQNILAHREVDPRRRSDPRGLDMGRFRGDVLNAMNV